MRRSTNFRRNWLSPGYSKVDAELGKIWTAPSIQIKEDGDAFQFKGLCMPNLLRFPIVLISIAVSSLWFVGSRDHQASTALEQQHDQLVLRVEEDPQSASPGGTRKRRATLRASKSTESTVTPAAVPAASTLATRARIVGLSPVEPNRPAPSAAPSNRFESQSKRVEVNAIQPPSSAETSDREFSPSRRANLRKHRIVDGDDLHRIADRYLGDASRFLEIFEANRETLSDPQLLPIGKDLKIPPK